MQISNWQDFVTDKAFIGGSWTEGRDGKKVGVFNPANGELLAMVPDMGANDTLAAITAAHEAFPQWSALTGSRRADLLMKAFRLMEDHHEALAQLLTLEQGKSLIEARAEITYGASYLQWFAEEAKRTYGQIIPSHTPEKKLMVIKQPVGVVCAITPWNFPNAMIARKLAAALAAGCTIIIKPAIETPLSALAIAKIMQMAGIPDGVVNIVTGVDAPQIGKTMTSDERVRKISFTGSTGVGKILLEQCAKTVKKTSMELGGNAPFIIFDDADIEKAVDGAVASKFRNCGQTCVCTNRFYVQSGIYDKFINKLSLKISELKVGDGRDETNNIGPLISEKAVIKVESHIDNALKLGAKIEIGGKRHPLGHTFFEPTILSGVTQNMQIAHEETFGPVAAIIKFDTEAEALKYANDSEFGLASYFYTNDPARIWRMSERLESGMVGVNTGLISTAIAPFGGIKQSGMGREGSSYGIDDYLEIKYICQEI